MCLKLNKNSEKKIANKKIVCFKVLALADDGFRTPYRHSKIEIEGYYESNICFDFDRDEPIITEAIHSFTSLLSAKNERDSWFPIKTVIAKCVIPKGSVYYEGDFETDLSSSKTVEAFASNAIQYIKIILK